MRNNQKQDIKPLQQRHFLIAINFLLVSVMLACFAFMMGRFLQAIYTGWTATLFSTLAFIIALESLILRHYQSSSSKILNNHIITMVVEVITILLIVKILSMILSGFSTIWIEIISWDQNFFRNFFDPDTLVRIFGLAIVWAMAWMFSLPLSKLEEDEKLMEQEKLGYTFNDRHDARRKLIGLIFFLGFAMILMMVILKSDRALLLVNGDTPSGNFIYALLIYFFAGFLFLSLNQYAIMKARWYFNDIKVSPDLAKRWLVYSLTFIFIIILLSLILPTNFTHNLSQIRRIISQLTLIIFYIIEAVIIFPLALFFMLMDALFSGNPINEEIQQKLPEMTPVLPQLTSPSPSPGWELLQSILFWSVFLGVIIFTILYYLGKRHNFKALLTRLKLSRWLKSILDWLKNKFGQTSQATVHIFQKGIENFRDFFNNQTINLPSLAILALKKPPRQAIILTYLDWVRWNKQHGFSRRDSQTPNEYAHAFIKLQPELLNTTNAFTHIFMRARYTNHLVDKTHADKAQILLAALKENAQSQFLEEEVDP